jgi:hypothetical protein
MFQNDSPKENHPVPTPESTGTVPPGGLKK